MVTKGKSLAVVCVVVVLGLANSAFALVEIKVDFAYPLIDPCDPCNVERHEKTKIAEPGWFIWASAPAWRDLSFHDPQWAAVIRWVDPIDPNVVHQILDANGISGTGINAKIAAGYQGNTSLKVFGMEWEGDGVAPTGTPKEDPICNSEIISHRHWGAGKTGRDGSLFLSFIGLPPGRYVLKSYHNDLVFLDPYTPETWTELEHRFMPDIVVTGEGVVQLQHDYNVPIQQEISDLSLVESVVMFETDRHEAMVEYVTWPIGGEYWGSAAVLNAFILQGVPWGTPYNPTPADGAENVHPDVVLKWRPGQYVQHAAGHNVYFGTNFYDVNNATDPYTLPGRGSQDANQYDPPGSLEFGVTYYWRIDEVNAVEPNSPWRGRVWSFTVDDGKAYNPNPGDAAQEVVLDANLVWTAGRFAAWHDVYFGTDMDAVMNATDPYTPPGRGRQDPCSYDPCDYDPCTFDPWLLARTYDPCGLEFGQTYYWRIDEGNSLYPTVKGGIWTFTAQNYLTVDDFQSYDPYTNLITGTWLDGIRELPYPPWSETVNGALLSLGASYAEPPEPVYDGNQSMIYSYDNSGMGMGVPYYSETERTYEDPCDWTALDVKAFVLHFYGDPNNDANQTEQMYVGLKDSAGNYAQVRYGDKGEDMNDIKKQDWQQWNIRLQDFSDINDVNLAAIKTVYIGFGDRDNPAAGGTGVVYFDAIRLYLSRCVPSIIKPEFDLNDDCIVDFNDVRIMSLDWLDIDSVEVTEPNRDGLLVEYTFDTDYSDTSGNGYDGVPGTEASISNGKLVLNGVLFYGAEMSYVNIPLGAANPFEGTGDYTIQMTFATTACNQALLSSAKAGSTSKDHPMALWAFCPREDKPLGSYEVHIWYTGGSPAPGLVDLSDGKMHSVVVAYDSLARMVHYYTDGYYDGSWPLRYGMPYIEQHVVRIGGCAASNFKSEEGMSSFVGQIDSVRIYNYCLSEPEALYLGTEGTGVRPMLSLANLYDEEAPGSKAVNLRDYAELASNWLEKSYWP